MESAKLILEQASQAVHNDKPTILLSLKNLLQTNDAGINKIDLSVIEALIGVLDGDYIKVNNTWNTACAIAKLFQELSCKYFPSASAIVGERGGERLVLMLAGLVRDSQRHARDQLNNWYEKLSMTLHRFCIVFNPDGIRGVWQGDWDVILEYADSIHVTNLLARLILLDSALYRKHCHGSVDPRIVHLMYETLNADGKTLLPEFVRKIPKLASTLTNRGGLKRELDILLRNAGRVVEMDGNEAAARIQALARGRRTRKRLQLLRRIVVTVQTKFRHARERKKFREQTDAFEEDLSKHRTARRYYQTQYQALLSIHPSQLRQFLNKEESAARRIQFYWKRYKLRQRLRNPAFLNDLTRNASAAIIQRFMKDIVLRQRRRKRLFYKDWPGLTEGRRWEIEQDINQHNQKQPKGMDNFVEVHVEAHRAYAEHIQSKQTEISAYERREKLMALIQANMDALQKITDLNAVSNEDILGLRMFNVGGGQERGRQRQIQKEGLNIHTRNLDRASGQSFLREYDDGVFVDDKDGVFKVILIEPENDDL